MSPWQAARPGDHFSAIDTSALLLDLDAFDRNLARMAEELPGSDVRLRAHAKSHKCPQIALRQMALGAVGICCQKLSEGAEFVAAGIKDVLITNEMMGDAELRHLVALARTARIGVLVDHLQQALATAAQAHGVTLDVYVEINLSANGCGVAPGEVAVQLARQIVANPRLCFVGLQCYYGPARHRHRHRRRACDRCGYRHLRARVRFWCLQRNPCRLLYLHGSRYSCAPLS